MPSSKEAKIDLRFETDIGTQFTLSINGGDTITQLKNEIAVEEKINVRRLQAMVFPQYPEHPDDMEELVLQELDGKAIISSLPLKSQVIAVTSRLKSWNRGRNRC